MAFHPEDMDVFLGSSSVLLLKLIVNLSDRSMLSPLQQPLKISHSFVSVYGVAPEVRTHRNSYKGTNEVCHNSLPICHVDMCVKDRRKRKMHDVRGRCQSVDVLEHE